MTIKETAKITGITPGRIEAQIKRGLLAATAFAISESGAKVYVIRADDVYEFARNEWFTTLTPMERPADVAKAMLEQYGDELSEKVKGKLVRLQHEDTKPRREKESRKETKLKLTKGA